MNDAFWSPRDCFLQPPALLLEGLEKIDEAVEAHLDNDRKTAQELLLATDFEEVRAYVDRVQGKNDPEVHRYREVAGAPPIERARYRMPSAKAQIAIFERDGWRCRFCGIKVILRAAIKAINEVYAAEVRWDSPQRYQHPVFRAACVSADHIVPHSRGGTNDPENIVAACGPCQFGRNQWLLEEVGINDPRERQPVVDEWDGLTRLL